MELIYSATDNIGTITLNRPHYKNALNATLIKSFMEQLKDLSNIAVLIIQGTDHNFCSGGDLNWMLAGGKLTVEDNIQDVTLLDTLFQSLYTLPIPTIAAINGVAFGAGVGLTACCDLAIAHPNSQFCLPEAKIGLAPALVAHYLIESMGKRNAKALALLSTTFTAEHALNLGLITHINDSSYNYAFNLAQKMTKTDPHAKKIIKNLFNDEYSAPNRQNAINTLANLRATTTAQTLIAEFLNR